MKAFMNTVSIVFHPLLMATYLCSVLLLNTPELIPNISQKGISYLIIAIFITTCLIPTISIFSLKAFAIIDSLSLNQRKDRFYPFIMICAFYGVTAFFFIEKIKVPSPISIMIISTAILIFILIIITKWVKISIHAAAAWATTGFISALSISRHLDLIYFLCLFAIISGLTCTSRLYLGRHTPKEIWFGTILGFVFSHLVIFLFT